MAVFFGLILAIGISGWLYLKAGEARLREAAENELHSVSDLKIAQIAQWNEERLADARVISEDVLLAESIQAWLANPGLPGLEDKLRQRMESVRSHYRYGAVILLGAMGDVLLAEASSGIEFADSDRQEALSSLAEDRVLLTDLYMNEGQQTVHQDIFIPLHSVSGGEPTAIINLIIDPNLFLFPMLQAWPTDSSSAESLLVRREGDQLLFLNELRHRKGPPLSFRLSSEASQLPAALAVHGVTGFIEGKDYRATEVLAYLQPVPETAWFLVCKVDRDEIYRPFNRLIWQTGLVMMAFILLSALWIHRLWRRQREQWAAERRRDLEQSEQRYRALFERMTEGFALHEIICDEQGAPRDYRFLEVNPAFEHITGLTREKVVGRTVQEVLPGTESRWIEAYGRVALTGEAVHFDQSHAGLGRHYDVFAYRPAPGQFAVLFMDITERKRAEEALRRSETRFRIALLSSPITVATLDRDLIIIKRHLITYQQ